MVGEEREPEHAGFVIGQEFADEDEVPQGFRHLLPAQADHADVHPVAHEGLPRRRFRLGGLALVVREDEIGAPAVEVDRETELARRER